MPSSNLKMHTPNLVDSNIDRIAELFPNCITEKPKTDANGNLIKDANGQAILERGIDFELLKQELSHSVIDGSQERYRLDWVGKREAIVTANSPIAKTLRPCRAESVDFDTTGNLFIEGDNLEALKLLQESYLGKVKMIYIDPPYNTGNDFIYNDDFAADTAEFFERSGQVDADGNRLVANTESNGRFHSDWLSMMYSRLKLARNLLADDGVIFISIDDNEVDNLRKVSDEIFSRGNFINAIAINMNSLSGVKMTHAISGKRYPAQKEYLLIYRKTPDTRLFIDKVQKGTWDKEYNLIIPNIKENQFNEFQNMTAEEVNSILSNMQLVSLTSFAKENNIDLTDEWKWQNAYRIFGTKSNTSLASKVKDEKYEQQIVCYTNNEGNNRFFRSDFNKETRDPRIEIVNAESNSSVFLSDNWIDISNDGGVAQEGGVIFPNGKKPLQLIKRIIQSANFNEGIVLDFFAGSSTTAHAVMQLNLEDGGSRRFIMVQVTENLYDALENCTNPETKKFYVNAIKFLESIDKESTIAELSKERIRRAGAKIRQDNTDKDLSQLDTGFRVLKIDTTNMNDIYYRPQDYSQDLLATLENNIKPDRSDEDLLFQFMLDTGVPLSLPIERTELSSKSGGHTIYQVGGNSLIASLDYIDANMVNDIAALNPLKFITSERAIATDSDKTNIKERFKQLSPHTDVRFI
ncbi:site-specific DNA-methyltransferase [Moraxella osloensis]|uniref:site-specific DNA-methyltransferase n=1 Tax=Faucicola osloensis TaxID=34062 RepID=UPI0034E051BC